MADTKAKDGLFSAILAAAVFLAFLLAVDAGILASLVAGGVAYAAGFFFLFRVKRPEVVAGETSLKAALQEGTGKLQEIKALEKRIRKGEVVAQVKDIEAIIGKILAKIQQDPSTLKRAHQFLGYYLDSTINILGKYVELGAQNIEDADIDNFVGDV